MEKIILVRSPEELTEQNLIGYGWSQLDFSSCETIEQVFDQIRLKNVDIGRQGNQIRRYFDIQEGDVIVVPVYRAIIIGVATGEKSYGTGVPYGENRISVNFFRDTNNKPVRIPRIKLKQQLQSRLKIRMTVVSLNEFSDDILKYVEQLKDNNNVCFDSAFQQKQEQAEINLKSQLLKNIRSGNTFLEAGGIGLEKLLLELVETEGYTGRIAAKNQFSTIADIDIEASRTDPLTSNKVFIQAKHHSGITSDWGIKQLVAIGEDEHVDKWLITTGEFSESVKSFTEQESINVKLMDGEGLVDWIYNRIDLLSPSTKEKLGISLIPQLII